MVDPHTLAMNIALLIGGFFALVLGGIAIYMLWTGINIGVWLLQRRKVDRDYQVVSHRADGKPYPPCMEGVCTRCGRGNRHIYFTGSGHELCPGCYDAFWREEEHEAGRNKTLREAPSPTSVKAKSAVA